MANKNKKPEIVNISSIELEEIKLRVLTNTLSDHDKKLVTTILTIYQWLYHQLQTAKLGMRRLRNFFGFQTEKNPSYKKPPNINITTTSNLNDEANLDPLLAKQQLNPGEPPLKK